MNIQLGAKVELARRDFFEYCHLKAPEFYRYDRQFLIDLADDLQYFLEDDEHDVLVVNEPPRHGKSRTAGNFVEWVLGKDPKKKIMLGSYNETLSTRFSKSVRNTIQEVKASEDIAVYSDIFPKTKIKYGDAAMNLWSLEGTDTSYLATSPTGTATGFGADILLIDDVIKNAPEANNANVLEGHWSWFTDTMLSRLETGGKIIIIMTRWHSEDLAGKAIRELPDLGYSVKHINMKALQDDGSMLCEDILSRSDYERKTKVMGSDIASANYQQEPIDIKGRLYTTLKTYDSHQEYMYIGSYTDTADEGSDYLATYIYGVTFTGEVHILDIIFTKDAMEFTEPLLAKKLFEKQVNTAWIESNNGGRGFGRSVERILKQEYKTNKAVIRMFHQSKNKKARILSQSTWVMEHIYFPQGWRNMWPDLHRDLTKYQREGKNAHDDCADALTGVAEQVQNGQSTTNPSAQYDMLKTAFGTRR